jgi:hypothetical protein
LSKPVITNDQLIDLVEAGFSRDEIRTQYVLPGEANVEAAQATEVNEELRQAALDLYIAGIKADAKTGKALRTKEGRLKSVSGARQGLGEFRVMVTAPKGYKVED